MPQSSICEASRAAKVRPTLAPGRLDLTETVEATVCGDADRGALGGLRQVHPGLDAPVLGHGSRTDAMSVTRCRSSWISHGGDSEIFDGRKVDEKGLLVEDFSIHVTK